MLNLSIDPNIYLSDNLEIDKNNLLLSDIFDSIDNDSVKIIYNKNLDDYHKFENITNLLCLKIDVNADWDYSEMYFAMNSHKMKYIKEVYGYTKDEIVCTLLNTLPKILHGFIITSFIKQYNEYYNNIIIGDNEVNYICGTYLFYQYKGFDTSKFIIEKNIFQYTNDQLREKITDMKDFLDYINIYKVFLDINNNEKIVWSENFISNLKNCEFDSLNLVTSLIRGIYYPKYKYANGKCDSKFLIEAHPDSESHKTVKAKRSQNKHFNSGSKKIYVNNELVTLYRVYVLPLDSIKTTSDNKYRIFYVKYNEIYILLGYTDEHDFSYKNFKTKEIINFENVDYTISNKIV